ncbi:MAG: hypothetical protein A2W90_09190 [Bacteroidetes bacterium GWF2_42_66]|nr:MAG: hypothetical protein A2W92_12165 [Bacteroidetes bacterium GWA2_42_15]OFY00581.1 MAG: hypothetical protein A2W89_20505 [Bacteroidetes bacterium GWE2_42_39]OFY42315.1 MAG: hypothetical protein A2W90_09190 [Bacteroidetes bacterium GWF2_42_66]HAZ02069.1 hypothetical protein [Marinilabiliales bacterium]HBL76469.1 hypothetical protein [Prolixibacteraceae bacterium]
MNHSIYKIVFFFFVFSVFVSCQEPIANKPLNQEQRDFNGVYTGDYLSRLAFPIGGIGSGMICLEGNGAISHVSVRNKPDIFNEPFLMAAISVKGIENGAKVLEGPVPNWKVFGNPNTGNGAGSSSYGFPRFEKASFETKFPFGIVKLEDKDIPMDVSVTGWNPFIPSDADNSSLPVGGLEYTFKNTGNKALEAAFSYHAENIMRVHESAKGNSVAGINNGFLLKQSCFPDKPHYKGDFAIFADDNNAVVDLCWFRGGWFDGRSMLWKDIQDFTFQNDTVTMNSRGASLYVPFSLQPGEEKTIRLMMAWYVPHSNMRVGLPPVKNSSPETCKPGSGCCPDLSDIYYEPWYSARFKDIKEVVSYWSMNYNDLRQKSDLFAQTFYNNSYPEEVTEAVAANLTILKSPTVLRLKDGRIWAWEGCADNSGCCSGSCTHVWNYAQALSHLFPALERSLRETEFVDNQNEQGHQTFRSTLPVKSPAHGFHAAADGQLGGIMKMYREWRISGDTEWMKSFYPKVKQSIDYCILTWDPKRIGALEEPHHNTYDIEFWGPDGMCTSFYLGALNAIVEMGKAVGDDVSGYSGLLEKGKRLMETELYDGEYFIQKIKWQGLQAKDPVAGASVGINMNYSDEARQLLEKEGPKYQYGTGCLSDGVLGVWISEMCGLKGILDADKVKSHLLAVHKYNLKTDLSDHVNPQRPSYAIGKEGGLLLCSWPKGGALSLPFVYSNEVWTGIEYQVASHLMVVGEVEKGLEIVREVRNRYDGRIRNPFNEYECGHWYARAMSSYGLIEGLTGIRYDAVDKTLFIDSKIGNSFTSFLAVDGGWGQAGLKDGKPFVDVKFGNIDVKKVFVSGKETELE